MASQKSSGSCATFGAAAVFYSVPFDSNNTKHAGGGIMRGGRGSVVGMAVLTALLWAGLASAAAAQSAGTNPQGTRRGADRIEDRADRRENRRDRQEDIRDRREDRRDRKEDLLDRREDIRDRKHNGGKRDRIEDRLDRRPRP
jgi:hypothetical protein